MRKTISVLLIITMLISALFVMNVSAEGETVTIDGITYTSYDTYCELTKCDENTSGEVIIPSTVNFDGKNLPVTQIDSFAFAFCEKMTSVTIPGSVNWIGSYAFRNCKGITSITIPDSVESIGENLFYDCSNLASVTIGSGLMHISDGMFENCSSLASITLPDSILNIENDAFNGCSNLSSITMPDSVKYIGEYAFNGCTALTSITIPGGVTAIYQYMLYGCSNLRSVTIPGGVTYISAGAFNNFEHLQTVYFKGSKDQWKTIRIGDDNDALLKAEIIFGKTVTVTIDGITYESFDTYCELTKCDENKSGKVTIPSSVNFDGYELPVQTIKNQSFWSCKKITYVDIPDSVEKIENSSFFDCDSLESVTIGKNVRKIGVAAFVDNDSLASITVSKDNTVYHSSGNCLIETSSKTLIVGCKNSVIPGDGSVTSIFKEAFESCVGLTSITIPKSVTSIGRFAFFGCDNLKTVYYTGSEAEWNSISVDDYNDSLLNAEIIFNYVDPSTQKGDINGDGEVNNKDVVTLFRFVSAKNSGYDANYDFNEDGEVNNKDVVELFRFVSSAK